MKTTWILAPLIGVTCVGLYAGDVLATPPTGVTTELVQAAFGNIDVNSHARQPSLWRTKIKTHGLSDVYVVHNVIAPGGSTGWHSHPGPSLILVTAGTVTNYEGDDPSCTPHTYTVGQGFVDAGGRDVHILRNEDPSVPAETMAVQILPQGATRRIDKPAPGNCPF
jgi:hypothetical protein